jgi:hypothetical protein
MPRRNKGNRWYVATMLFLTKGKEQTEGPWTTESEERLLLAPNNEAAYKKALDMGQAQAAQETEDMKDDPWGAGEVLQMEFLGLSSLVLVDDGEIRDGSKISSDLWEEDEHPSALVTKKESLRIFFNERMAKEHPDARPEEIAEMLGLDPRKLPKTT